MTSASASSLPPASWVAEDSHPAQGSRHLWEVSESWNLLVQHCLSCPARTRKSLPLGAHTYTTQTWRSEKWRIQNHARSERCSVVGVFREFPESFQRVFREFSEFSESFQRVFRELTTETRRELLLCFGLHVPCEVDAGLAVQYQCRDLSCKGHAI